MNYIQENEILTQLSGYATNRALLITIVFAIITIISLFVLINYLESQYGFSVGACLVIYVITTGVCTITSIGLTNTLDADFVKSKLVIETQEVKVTLDEDILYKDIKEATSSIKIMENGSSYFVNVDANTAYTNTTNKEAVIKTFKIKDFKGPLKWLLSKEQKQSALDAEITPTAIEVSYSSNLQQLKNQHN